MSLTHKTKIYYIMVTYLSKNSVQECSRNPNSRLHTKIQLSSLKDKKVGEKVQSARCAVQNMHCAHPVSQKIVYRNVMKC